MGLSDLLNKALADLDRVELPAFPSPAAPARKEQTLDDKKVSYVSYFSQPKNRTHIGEQKHGGAIGPQARGSRVESYLIQEKQEKQEKPCGTVTSAFLLPAPDLGNVGNRTGSESTPSLTDGSLEERAALRECEGGFSRDQADALARADLALPEAHPTPAKWRIAMGALSPLADPCPGFRPGEWRTVQRTALAFLEEFGEQAAALGWTTLELFGVHPNVGIVRVDCAGALMVSGGSRVVALTSDTIRYADGLSYRRSPVGPAVPVWDFSSRPASLSNRAG